MRTGTAATATSHVVLDASVLVEYLAPGRLSEEIGPLFGSRRQLHRWIPDLCILEVANAFRSRYRFDKDVPRPVVEQAIDDLLALEAVAVPAAALVRGAVSYMDRLTPYDAAYIVLAKARGAVLVTLDKAMAREAGRAEVSAIRPGTRPFRDWLVKG